MRCQYPWHWEHLPCKAISLHLYPPPVIKPLASKCTLIWKGLWALFSEYKSLAMNGEAAVGITSTLCFCEPLRTENFFYSQPTLQFWFLHFCNTLRCWWMSCSTPSTQDWLQRKVALPWLWAATNQLLWVVIKDLHIFKFSTFFLQLWEQNEEEKVERTYRSTSVFRKQNKTTPHHHIIHFQMFSFGILWLFFSSSRVQACFTVRPQVARDQELLEYAKETSTHSRK